MSSILPLDVIPPEESSPLVRDGRENNLTFLVFLVVFLILVFLIVAFLKVVYSSKTAPAPCESKQKRSPGC